jgi:hypothetical protein
VWEGEDRPPLTDTMRIAQIGWELLERDGGIDWSGLEPVVELLGIVDVELFVWMLHTFKSHVTSAETMPGARPGTE